MKNFGLLSSVAVACFGATAAALAKQPFKAVGSAIQDNSGTNWTFVGGNWPGHGAVMIPEGLQYQPISSIVGKIKSLRFNIVRLTFAIEMVDNILDNGGDVTLRDAFDRALGGIEGPKKLDDVIRNNPGFTPETTRLQVYDAVAAELAKQNIYVHLDNHVSKAQWCCSTTDGNAWFGDRYFNVERWKRGLSYMADHGKNWDSLASIGLRNELRRVGGSAAEPYDWLTWYNNMIPAGEAVNKANPNVLIYYSGLDFDHDLSPIPDAEDLGLGLKFEKSKFSYADKMVLELHSYDGSIGSCDELKGKLWANGFKAIDEASVNVMPVILSEFGYSQVDGSYQKTYASCLRDYVPAVGVGWMVWLLGGSYYTREGQSDYDDTWGLLNHDWSAWRSQEAIDNGIGKMIEKSLGQ